MFDVDFDNYLLQLALQRAELINSSNIMAAGGSFKRAFAAARRAKKKTFMWNGRLYTTDLASESTTNRKLPATRTTAQPRPGQIPLKRQQQDYLHYGQTKQMAKSPQVQYVEDLIQGKRRIPSKNNKPLRNREAIEAHKAKYGVTDPYIIIEKNGPNGPVARFYNNNEQKLVTPILAGSAYGDGYYPTPKGNIDYSKEPGLSGAGIYTINWRETSPYINHEPMMELHNNGAFNTRQAIHGLASQARWDNIEDGNPNNNRVTNGCFTLPLGYAKGVYDSGIFQNGDTVYVVPEVGGNYITEQNGKLQTVWEAMPQNNPTSFTLPNGFSGPVYYNGFK